MAVITIILVLVFSITLSIVEIPKMKKNKEFKELAAFSIILFIGTLLTVLKSLDVDIPNPADLIAAIFSPIVSLMKGALE